MTPLLALALAACGSNNPISQKAAQLSLTQKAPAEVTGLVGQRIQFELEHSIRVEANDDGHLDWELDVEAAMLLESVAEGVWVDGGSTKVSAWHRYGTDDSTVTTQVEILCLEAGVTALDVEAHARSRGENTVKDADSIVVTCATTYTSPPNTTTTVTPPLDDLVELDGYFAAADWDNVASVCMLFSGVGQCAEIPDIPSVEPYPATRNGAVHEGTLVMVGGFPSRPYIVRYDNSTGWTDVTPPGSYEGFEDVLHDGAGWVAVGDDGVWRSSDDGFTWTQTDTTQLYRLVQTDSGRLLGHHGSGNDLYGSDDGETFEEIHRFGAHPIWSIVQSTGQIVAFNGDTGVWISEDDGETWIRNGAADDPEIAYNRGAAQHHGTTISAGYNVARSTDGLTWTDVTPPEGVGEMFSVAYSPEDDSWLIGGRGSELFVSRDDGLTWTRVPYHIHWDYIIGGLVALR